MSEVGGAGGFVCLACAVVWVAERGEGCVCCGAPGEPVAILESGEAVVCAACGVGAPEHRYALGWLDVATRDGHLPACGVECAEALRARP